MGFREGAKDIWKNITKRPTVPEEQHVRTNVPMEPFGAFTIRIPQEPAEDIKPPTPDGGLPIKPTRENIPVNPTEQTAA